ncbi:glycerate kinase [Flavilitoribacter nigricans]|nr:glycerate kinase [Flavilitoribacter nigricans]
MDTTKRPKIIIAPDKFKGSLSAREVCAAIRTGIRQVIPEAEIVEHPLADGGEGSLDILADFLEVEVVEAIVQDPLFRPLRATYLRHGETAFVEMARASGLPLLKATERSARATTTYGTGQLIRNALQRGSREIMLFVGGSATTDGGIGMASALGYRFLDKHGAPVKPVGEDLMRIERIDGDQRYVDPATIRTVVVSDVKNPLYGEQGAARVFGPQKGATEQDVALLDAGLERLAELVKRDLGVEIGQIPGAGAAGGLGAGGVAFLGAEIRSGIHTMIGITQLAPHLQDADLIITGEGMLDHQSLQGKVIAGVAELAGEHRIPCAVIAGNTSLQPTEYRPLGIQQVYTVMEEGLSLEQAIREARDRVEKLAQRLAGELLEKK